MHTNTHTHAHTRTCTHTHTYAHTHMHTHTHTHAHTRMHTHTHACTHMHTHTHAHGHIKIRGLNKIVKLDFLFVLHRLFLSFSSCENWQNFGQREGVITFLKMNMFPLSTTFCLWFIAEFQYWLFSATGIWLQQAVSWRWRWHFVSIVFIWVLVLHIILPDITPFCFVCLFSHVWWRKIPQH